MTNQEAIDIIKTAIAELEWEYPMDYAAAFDMAVKALEQQESGWISVKDRMPPNDDTKVLTYGDPVTHWMPLPEPPKEE